MTEIEIDDALNKISASLKPCPICKGKAEIFAMHTTLKEVVINSIGCRKCHLTVERKWRFAKSDKLFVKRTTTIVNPVHIWNQRISEKAKKERKIEAF